MSLRRDDPIALVLDQLEANGCGPRANGAGWAACCPAHPDKNPSLGLKRGDDGRALILCRAGCPLERVLDALGLVPADLFVDDPQRHDPDEGEWTPHGPAVAVYDYEDAEGRLLFQSCRTADKQFPCRRPDPGSKSGWRWKLGEVPRVLYRLPRVLEAVGRGDPVFVVEGEKDVHAVERAGEVATCNPGGAGKWRREYAEMLEGADVVVVADRDPAGYDHARAVAASLEGLAKRVRVVRAVEGKDVSDHLAAGHSLEDLELVDLDEEDTGALGTRNRTEERARAETQPEARGRGADHDALVVLRERLGPETDEELLARQARMLEEMLVQERLRRLTRHLLDREEKTGPVGGGPSHAAFEGRPLLSAVEFLYGDELVDGEPLHGRGAEVLHASGEATLVVAVTGVGKSTYAQNYVAHRLGLLEGGFIGYPVKPLAPGEAILYVAADRAWQIVRSFRRLVAPADAEKLVGRLVFHRGPLPFLLNRRPDDLLPFVVAKGEEVGVRIVEVVLDSLKDVASELAKPEGGEGVQRALGLVTAEGIDVLVLHHERKSPADAKKGAVTLDKIYGAHQLTACMGNVVYLDGPPGAYVSTLRHLKQSNDIVGPLSLYHDHDSGLITVEHAVDLLVALRGTPKGMTVRTAATILSGQADPDANAQKGASRRLKRLVAEGLAWCNQEGQPEGGWKVAALYFATERRYGECP